MRSPVKGFHYVATIGSDHRRGSELWLDGRVAGEQSPPFFAGPTPRLRFREDLVIIVTNPVGTSALKWGGFRIGDAIQQVGTRGDTVEISRSACGDLVVKLFRAGALVLAAGPLMGKNLGIGLTFTRPFDQAPEQRALKVSDGRVSSLLSVREAMTMAGYDIYLENVEPISMYGGLHECISVARVDVDGAVNAARRSATLMAERYDDGLRGESRNGRILKSTHEINLAWHEEEAGFDGSSSLDSTTGSI